MAFNDYKLVVLKTLQKYDEAIKNYISEHSGGNYNELFNLPSINGTTLKGDKSHSDLGFGTASDKDVPESGDALSSQVVMGNDTRLSDARNAADVYSWAKAASKPSYTASEVGAIATTAKGATNGVAELDSSGKVPSAQLPSYVDDVLEYASRSAFPGTGEREKIYVALDTNKTYRWSGTAYVEISESLALGETSSTAYAGDKGKANADAITAIKDGTSIDSFGDVETALSGKQNTTTFDSTHFDTTLSGETVLVDVKTASEPAANDFRLIDADSAYKKMYSVNATAETNIDDADYFPYFDSSVGISGIQRKTLWSNIKAKLKAYFDTLYASLSALASRVDWSSYAKTGAVNKLDMKAVSGSMSDVTYTVNADKTIDLSGTTSGNFYIVFTAKVNNINNYSDACIPSGTSFYPSTGNENIKLNLRYTDGQYSGELPNNELFTTPKDVGNVYVFWAGSGNNLSGIKLKPMLAEAPNVPYAPYAMTNQQLTTDKLSWAANAVLGAHQLINLPLYTTSKTDQGITYTAGINNKGLLECTFNGTSTEYAEFQIKNRTESPISLPAGKYKLTGGYSSGLFLRVGHTANGAWEQLATSYGGTGEFTLNEPDNNIGIFYGISAAGVVCNNLKLYPMIRVAEDTVTEPAPPAMTNQQLTEQVTPIHTIASAASNIVTFPDNFFKSVVKDGKTVFFNVRFTTSDVTPTSVVPLVNIGYAPDASYPLFTLRKRLQPYDEVCALYMGVSGELTAYGIVLPADDYWVTGTYICK